MSEVKVIFKNYKALKEGEFNISDGSVFFVQGPNEIGKTSFVHLLQSIMEVKDDTVNPVTFNEKEGYALGTIPGADGKQYQFRYDFNIDGKKKFVFTGPDNKVIKTVGEMRAIFNYTHFTVEEFEQWSLTAAGRKKQRDILLMLLTEKEREEIASIDGKINTTTGEIYMQRQTVNRDIDYLKTIVEKGTGLSQVDMNTLNSKNKIEETFTQLTNEKKLVEDYLEGTKTQSIRLENAERNLKICTDNHALEVGNIESFIGDIELQIEELNKRLAKKKEELKQCKLEYTPLVEELNKTVNDIKVEFDAKKVEEQKIALDTINKRLEDGTNYKNSLIRIEATNEVYKKNSSELITKQIQANEYTEQINTLRKRKESIIQNSDAIPHDYSIGDDYITIDGVPFVDTDISKSRATKAIAKLMMKVNQCPIMLMGDAEVLGFDALAELNEEAEKNGKIMIFAEHVRTLEEIKLVCYDDLEKPEVKPTKELF